MSAGRSFKCVCVPLINKQFYTIGSNDIHMHAHTHVYIMHTACHNHNASACQDQIHATLDDQFSEGGFNGLHDFKIMAAGKWVSMNMAESLVAGFFTVTCCIVTTNLSK